MENTNRLRYLIAETGGVGGSIAGFLSLAGKNVTCIAREAHLQAIQQDGPGLGSDLESEHTPRVGVCTTEEYNGKADVVFVCAKGHSVNSITGLTKRASHENTIVIPISSMYGTGPRVRRLVPGITVLDGCIYIVGFVPGPGEITQMGTIFRLVYGAHYETVVPVGMMEIVQRDLQGSGVKVEISPDINRGISTEWSFISAMAVTGACYNVPMGEVQEPGRTRDTLIGLSAENVALGRELGVESKGGTVTYSLEVIDKLAPESTAPTQKDIARGHESEVQGLLFDMITAAEEWDIDVSIYREVAKKLIEP